MKQITKEDIKLLEQYQARKIRQSDAIRTLQLTGTTPFVQWYHSVDMAIRDKRRGV